MQRYGYDDLMGFSSGLLGRAGLAPERSEIVAFHLLEADLLGYATHGMRRLATNVDWLVKGETAAHGDPELRQSTAHCETWDARFLPGPWVAAKAVDRACEMAAAGGVGLVAVKRVQHVACLAAYLSRATDRRMLVMLTVSTPAEEVVLPHGGLSAVFSCNPIAAGIPTNGKPILIDTTVAMSAQGPLNRDYQLEKVLPYPMIMRFNGTLSDDPADFVEGRGAILPLGGVEQGYKGYGLAFLTEALSGALSGFGRSGPANTGEANALFVQVIDPDHFAGRNIFEREMGWLAEKCRSSRPMPGSIPVRVPGDRALSLKSEQLREGVAIAETIVDGIRPWAERLDCPFPSPIG